MQIAFELAPKHMLECIGNFTNRQESFMRAQNLITQGRIFGKQVFIIGTKSLRDAAFDIFFLGELTFQEEVFGAVCARNSRKLGVHLTHALHNVEVCSRRMPSAVARPAQKCQTYTTWSMEMRHDQVRQCYFGGIVDQFDRCPIKVR